MTSSQSFFTSGRERRLWFRALAVVVAIWASLGLAGTLVESLRSHQLLGVAFFLGFVSVMSAIAACAIKRRPGGREIWVAVGIAAVYAMVVVRMGVSPIERTHLFEYGLVAVLIHHALLERRRGGRRVPSPAALAVTSTALLGWADEAIQAVLPNRVYDLRDVGVNAIAGLMAILATLALTWARRKVAP